MKTVDKIFENTQDKNKFLLKKSKINKILEKKEKSISIEIPFESNILQLDLGRKEKNNDSKKIYITKNNKTEVINIKRNDIYYIKDNLYSGFAIMNSDKIHMTINKGNKSYLVDNVNDNEYEIKEIFADPNKEFKCSALEVENIVKSINNQKKQTKSLTSYNITMIYDVDYFTYSNSFNSDVNQINLWVDQINANNQLALYNALRDGIHYPRGSPYVNNPEIWDYELNLVKSVHIWGQTDPMASYVNDAGNMLGSLRNTWLTDPSLVNLTRDYVHLLTTRTNTGTGGIAWLAGFCSTYGYALSANLDLNNSKWNQMVVPHEFGHNLSASHTHDCGWSTGALDSCYTPQGGCSGPGLPQPTPSNPTGTIMSYCHTISGGISNITSGNYHSTVIEEAFVEEIRANSGCLVNCTETGCTDPNACNYNPTADCDDNSCRYPGCTDPTKCNYDPNACADDGSCSGVEGCTDPFACNYNPLAGCNDGTCDYMMCAGCTQPSACNYNSSATINDGSCLFPGCTDPSACNYNPSAGCDDGSCKRYKFLGSCTNFNYTIFLVIIILAVITITVTSTSSRSQKKRNNINIIKDLNEINDKIKDLSKKLKNI